MHAVEPGGDGAARALIANPSRSRSRTARPSCRSRGSPVGSSRGAAGSARAGRRSRRGHRFAGRRGRAGDRDGAGTPRCRFPRAAPPMRWRSRWARCSAGSSPRAPATSATTSARACAGWAGRDLGRRAHRARRDGAAAPAAGAAQPSARRVERLVLGALDARARRRRAPRPHGRRDARARCARSIRKVDARALTRSALTGMVDAICRDSARRIEVPAAPPSVRTGHDVAEAFLARLDGSAFDAPVSIGARDRQRASNAGPARSPADTRASIVQLDPPDDGGAWHLAVFAPGRRARRSRSSRRSSPAVPNASTSRPRSAASSGCCPRCCRPGGTAAGR